jgi:AraC-like DNA-binding protein
MKPPLTDRALSEQLPSWGVLVLESHHSPEFTMEWRTHPFVKVVYVLSGRGLFFLGNKEEAFAATDVIVVPPGTRNRIVDDPNSAASLYICCVARNLLRFDRSLSTQLPCRVLRRESHFAHRVASVFRRMVHAQQSTTTLRPVSLVADAMKLIQMISERSNESHKSERGSTSDRQRVQQYVDSLPSRFFEETSIDATADRLEIPRRTFTKLFAEIAGNTWLQHLRRLAIEHAQRRLRGSDVPIASISFECGFNDLSTFYRQFRRHCGMSPGEYRTSAGLNGRTG